MIISNIKIVSSEKEMSNMTIEIIDDKITKISQYSGELSDIKINDGDIVIPGFIDQHTHGGYGFDTMDSDEEGLKTFLANTINEGITSILPTTMTMSEEKIKNALKNLNNDKNFGSKILGIHLEGPFINCAYKGAQNEKYILEPNEKMIDEFVEINHKCKIVTYAPERQKSKFSEHLITKGLVPSIGHSNATMKQVKQEIDKGVHSITHLHNAHSKYDHRNPGILNAGLAYDELFVELICDGIHIDKEVIKSTAKIKGANKIILVTDSMRAKGLKDGEYDLGGQNVTVANNSARLKDGTLAGSILKMDEAFRNYIEFTGCELSDAVKVTSTNSAKNLNIKNIGDIKKDYIADLLILDKDLKIKNVIINGKKIK